MPLVLKNACVIGPDRLIPNATVVVDRGRIQSVGRLRGSLSDVEMVDCRGAYLAPGFIDIHNHGGAGSDFMDGTPEAVRTALRAHATHGTTTVFPTTTTGTRAQIRAMLKACGQVKKEWRPDQGARLAGVHFYGPYFAKNKTGCHRAEARRNPDPREYAEAFATGLIRVATCAAELPGAEAFYRAAKKHKCLVTCGHSDASWPEMDRAFKAGMSHVDHFWCAMSSVPSVRARLGTPMRGSMAEFVLAHPKMSTEILADGQHLAPELLEFAWRMKGPDQLLLVTDASRAMDMPPGRYRFGHRKDGPWFVHDGQVGRDPKGGLSSSVVGMDVMVRTMAQQTSAGIVGAVRMASLNPAKRTGLARSLGSIEVGKRADLVLLSKTLRVKRVWIDGYVVDVTRPYHDG